MITQTMVHNSIEDAKKAIRQNLESKQFAEVLITINAWVNLKELEDKLKSGSVETKEVEKDFDLSCSLCQPIYNPDKRLDDMDATVTDSYDELDKARALIKKYVLEDKRKQAIIVAVRAYQIAFQTTNKLLKVKNEINSLYQKEFSEPSPAIVESDALIKDGKIFDNALISGNAIIDCDATIAGDAQVFRSGDYQVFKIVWDKYCSDANFTYTNSNKMWWLNGYHLTGEELIELARHKEGEVEANNYKAYVELVEKLEQINQQ